MARRKKYAKKPFESTGDPSDVSANIYLSMVTSEAWFDLTKNQRCLYDICKLQFYAEKTKPNGDLQCFTMNRFKWCDLYRLYSDSNHRSFYSDMAALIEHGFISCVESGANTRTKSVYRFSEKWQRFGQPDFKIHPNEKTSAMLRKFN